MDLFRKIKAYAIGSFLSKMITFALLPFITRTLGVAQFGTYDLVCLVTDLFVPVGTVMISEALYKELCGSEIPEARISVFSSSALVLAVGILLTPMAFPLFRHYLGAQNAALVIVNIIVTAMFMFMQSALRGIGLTKHYAFSGTLYTFLYAGNVVVAFMAGYKSYVALIVATTLALVLTDVYLAIILARHKIKLVLGRINLSETKRFLQFSWPLVFNFLSWWLLFSGIRLIIVKWYGVSENGVFALAFRFATLVKLLNSIFFMAWQDRFLANLGEDGLFMRIFAVFYRYQCLLFVVANVGIIFAMPLFFERSYGGLTRYMPMLLLAVIFDAFAFFYSVLLYRDNRTIHILFSTILAVAVCYLFVFGFVKRFGLFIFPVGFMCGNMACFMYRLVMYWKGECIDSLLDFGCYIMVMLAAAVFGMWSRITGPMFSALVFGTVPFMFLLDCRGRQILTNRFSRS